MGRGEDRETIHVVLMGTAGCGKTTVLRELGDRLGWDVGEGDSFHSAANLAKMTAGSALNDEDRWPWLDGIVEWTSAKDAAGKSTLLSCSALRRRYRDKLRTAAGATVFVHLSGDEELIAARLAERVGHFMPTSLLASQLAALEPLQEDELGITVAIDCSTEDIAAAVIDRLHLEPIPGHR